MTMFMMASSPLPAFTTLLPAFNTQRLRSPMAWLCTQRGCGGIAPTHFQRGTQRRQEVKPCSSHFTTQKDPLSTAQEAGCASELVWTSWEISSPPGLNSYTVQPMKSLCQLH